MRSAVILISLIWSIGASAYYLVDENEQVVRSLKIDEIKKQISEDKSKIVSYPNLEQIQLAKKTLSKILENTGVIIGTGPVRKIDGAYLLAIRFGSTSLNQRNIYKKYLEKITNYPHNHMVLEIKTKIIDENGEESYSIELVKVDFDMAEVDLSPRR